MQFRNFFKNISGITISKFGTSDLWWSDKNDVKAMKLSNNKARNDRFVKFLKILKIR